MKTANPIVLLAGGNSSERQVSLWTAETITASLARQQIPHQLIDPRSPNWLNHLLKLSPDVVIIALHGTFGEDGIVQKILEDNNVVFTGSGSEVAKIAFNKLATKELIRSWGIVTPDWQKTVDTSAIQLKPPVVVKPAAEGSSYGVTIVWNSHEIEPAIITAREYCPEILVEKYIGGTEITCGVIDVFGKLQALPLVEIRPETEFFDFQAKYDSKFCHEICPAEISTELTKRIQEESVKIFSKLKCRQYARVDWILSNQTPYFLEINTLPGMTKTSLLNKELNAANISFDHFIRGLLDTAKYSKQKKITS